MLNNRGEVTCVGVKNWRGKEKVLATTSTDGHGMTLLHPCDGSDPIGPRWYWTDMLPDLCRRVCGKCPSRQKDGDGE